MHGKRWITAAAVVLATAALAWSGDGDAPSAAKAVVHAEQQATVARVPPHATDADHRLRVVLRVPMGSPGWKLTSRPVGAPDAHGRLRIDLVGEALEGMWPAVITDLEHEVELPDLPPGSYVLDIWLDDGLHDAHRAGATMIRVVGDR